MRGSNPVDVLLGRTAPSHLPTARSTLNRMAAHFSDGQHDARAFPWHELTYAQVADLRAQLGRQHAPRTANNYLLQRSQAAAAVWTADDDRLEG